MNYLYGLLIALMFSITAFAQADNGKKTVVIPRIKDPEVKFNKTPAKAEMPRFKTMDFSDSVLDKDKPLTFPKEGSKTIQIGQIPDKKPEQFISPYEIPKNALPKPHGDENTKVFRRNQSFGEIKTKGNSVKIIFRDFGAIDDDLVKISINSMVISANVNLAYEYKEIEIGLTFGFNKIDVEALNQGTLGPNTGEFLYFDDKGKLLYHDQWNLATGFKASIMIIKE